MLNDTVLPTFRVLAEWNQVKQQKVHTLSHCLYMQTCRWGEDRRTVGYTLVSIFVGSAENCFDVGHRGPELCCCFEESESDCNGPPCAPACLPLRFTTHLIRSAGKKNQPHTLLTHILSLVYLYFPTVCLSHSFPSSHLCVIVFWWPPQGFITPAYTPWPAVPTESDVFFPMVKTPKIKSLYYRSLSFKSSSKRRRRSPLVHRLTILLL